MVSNCLHSPGKQNKDSNKTLENIKKIIDTVAPGRFNNSFKSIIFKLIIQLLLGHCVINSSNVDTTKLH